MDKLFAIFESTSPLLVVVNRNREEVSQVVDTAMSHVGAGVDISSDLEATSNELLYRSEGKSEDTSPIIVSTVIDEADADSMDFVHLDNIATQGEQYNIGAVIGLVSEKSFSELLNSTSSMEKFALKKATLLKPDFVLTYLSS